MFIVYNQLTRINKSGLSFCTAFIKSSSGSYIILSDVVKGPEAAITENVSKNNKDTSQLLDIITS